MNKLIFSRKGFDSKYCGIPSTWAEDGELVSFPIPSTGELDDGIAPDATRYDAITGGGTTLDARRRALAPGRGFDDHCHHDPDRVEGSRPRDAGATTAGWPTSAMNRASTSSSATWRSARSSPWAVGPRARRGSKVTRTLAPTGATWPATPFTWPRTGSRWPPAVLVLACSTTRLSSS